MPPVRRAASSTALPGAVRIIGGELRGSKLSVPARPGLRPSPQRLRQTLFDWLAPVIAGARVLDAFAGTGALGIEALSRGAGEVVFFEHDAAQAAAIGADLERLHQSRGRVVCTDALEALAAGSDTSFDVVFLDPPFALDAWDLATSRLAAGGWLAPRALIYVETPRGQAWSPPQGWSLHRERAAGEVCITLWRA